MHPLCTRRRVYEDEFLAKVKERRASRGDDCSDAVESSSGPIGLIKSIQHRLNDVIESEVNCYLKCKRTPPPVSSRSAATQQQQQQQCSSQQPTRALPCWLVCPCADCIEQAYPDHNVPGTNYRRNPAHEELEEKEEAAGYLSDSDGTQQPYACRSPRSCYRPVPSKRCDPSMDYAYGSQSQYPSGEPPVYPSSRRDVFPQQQQQQPFNPCHSPATKSEPTFVLECRARRSVSPCRKSCAKRNGGCQRACEPPKERSCCPEEEEEQEEVPCRDGSCFQPPPPPNNSKPPRPSPCVSHSCPCSRRSRSGGGASGRSFKCKHCKRKNCIWCMARESFRAGFSPEPCSCAEDTSENEDPLPPRLPPPPPYSDFDGDTNNGCVHPACKGAYQRMHV